MPSKHLILCCPLLLPSSFLTARSVPMSWLFSSGGQSFGASASTSVLPMNIQGWFRIDWFDLPTVQGTLKSLLQHHNSKASILHSSAFFMVQLSHPYMTTGKTIALTRWTFVGKVMSLLFNTLSRFVIAFLPRSIYFWLCWVFFKKLIKFWLCWVFLSVLGLSLTVTQGLIAVASLVAEHGF